MSEDPLESETKSMGMGSSELPELLYQQLRAAAQRQMASERPGHTLSATALVHEAYIRLAGPRQQSWQGNGHFYAAAVEAMRRILLDHAKGRNRAKRGGGPKGGRARIDLDEVATLVSGPDEEILDYVAIEESIRRLEEVGPRVAEIVRLRFYAGLSTARIAEVLGVSERTVSNDWTFAKAWLGNDLGSRED